MKFPFTSLTTLLSLLALILLIGCSQREHDVKGEAQGEWVSESQYKNDFFSFSFTSPEGWQLTQKKPPIGNKVQDSDLGNAYLAAYQKTYTPFSVTDQQQSSFHVVIENTSSHGISDAAHYLQEALKGIDVVKGDITITSHGGRTTYLGTDWVTAEILNKSGVIPLYHKIYVKVKDRNALCLTTTSPLENNETLEKVMAQSLQFTQ